MPIFFHGTPGSIETGAPLLDQHPPSPDWHVHPGSGSGDHLEPSALARRPLTGIRVVDAGPFIAGRFAAAILADLGADVIKVEPRLWCCVGRFSGIEKVTDGTSLELA